MKSFKSYIATFLLDNLSPDKICSIYEHIGKRYETTSYANASAYSVAFDKGYIEGKDEGRSAALVAAFDDGFEQGKLFVTTREKFVP